MANGIRTIYSPRQRMAPGQYETPFADFLDRLPDYVNQFQKNQLALGQQQLQAKRYADAQEQRELTNELNVFKFLDPEDVPDALATSKNPKLKNLGANLKTKRQGFTNQINKIYTDNVGNPLAILTGLEGLLSQPHILSNPRRVSTIQDRIEIENPKVARKQINQWIQDNPNDSRVSAISLQAQTDPEGAVKALMPARTTISTAQHQVYNPFTKEYYFATNQEIAAAKATPTTEDDIIPLAGAPSQRGKGGAKSLTQINKAISDVSNALNPRKRRIAGLPDLTSDQEVKLRERLQAFEDQRDSVLLGDPTKKSIPDF